MPLTVSIIVWAVKCVSQCAPTNSETSDESGPQAGHFMVLQP